MIKRKTIKIEKTKIISIICDKCKKEYDDFEIQEFHHINFVGGFNSVFGDETEIECDICQHCLKNMIKGLYREF